MFKKPPERNEVKKVKTAHGTQVARAIVCTACGAEDTVRFAPRDADRVLCRKCAAEQLGIEDHDAGILPQREWQCSECDRQEVGFWRGDDPYVCTDCRQGILSHQKNRTKNAERVNAGKVLRIKRDKPSE